VIEELLTDDDWREALSEQAYMRERRDEAAVDRERDAAPEETSYLAVAWESLSDHARRPYRTAVAETCDNLLEVMAGVA
jgi:hypothetical protein